MLEEINDYLQQFENRPCHKPYSFMLKPFSTYLESHNLSLADAKYTDVKLFLDGIDGIASYRAKVCQTIRQLYKWVWLYKNPDATPAEDFVQGKRIEQLKGIKFETEDVPDKRKALSLEEMNLLLETAKGKPMYLFYLYGYFGLRANENFRITEINFPEMWMTVHTEKRKKSVRQLYFDKLTGNMLKTAKELGWLTVPYGTFYNTCVRYKYLFPNIDFSPHSFRHTFNSNMRNQLKDDPLLKYLMGHVSTEITARYDEEFDAEKKSAMNEKHYYNKLPAVLKMREKEADK